MKMKMSQAAFGMAMAWSCGQICCGQTATVSLGKAGRLVYGATAAGDRIADFSYAGYRGGGVALPRVAVKKTVAPAAATAGETEVDQTPAIQAAINEVSALPLVDGVRGAVQLAAGQFDCAGTITIAASGVVLEGAGVGRTVIAMTGAPHLAVRIAGKLQVTETGAATTIADAYVPSGTMSFRVADAAGLGVGDTVEIVKQATPAWVHFMGMDTLGVRDGKMEHWVEGALKVRRKIAGVSGNLITLSVPLMDSYDAKLVGAPEVRRVEVTGQIAEVGLESLRVVAPARTIALGKDPEFDGLAMGDAVDGWVKDVGFEETTNAVVIGSGTERVTVTRVSVVEHKPVTTPAKPFDFSTSGSQILFDRVAATGDRVFYAATQARQQGPVVVLHGTFHGDGAIEPHQRWSTGMLVDECEVPEGSIQFVNRFRMGTGHGWAMGWGVVWNSEAELIVIQQPPGTVNLAVGNRSMQTMGGSEGVTEGGPVVPAGAKVTGRNVAPGSLYLEQLRERLGDRAVKAIGY